MIAMKSKDALSAVLLQPDLLKLDFPITVILASLNSCTSVLHAINVSRRTTDNSHGILNRILPNGML